MNIKSLLIGSAAALASATVVNAADAIVAAEPEPLEYVRICDAFGTGFFYIPGTETCLKIGGYARFELGFGRDKKGTSDWNATSRGQLRFDARSETELGALRSFIDLRFDADNAAAKSGGFLYQGFIELGGFRAGKFDSWWDDGLSGETDVLATNANFNSVRYNHNAGSWSFGVSVDELERTGDDFFTQGVVTVAGPPIIHTYSAGIPVAKDNNVGIAANFGADFGGVNFALLGGYDFDQEAGAIRAMLTAAVGSGTLGLAGIWSSDPNAYFAESEWAIAAEYALKATDRLTITPAAQFFGNYQQRMLTAGVFNQTTGVWTTPAVYHADAIVAGTWSSDDAWKAGVTVDYAITSGLNAKISAQYLDIDQREGEWSGFVRLDRSF